MRFHKGIFGLLLLGMSSCATMPVVSPVETIEPVIPAETPAVAMPGSEQAQHLEHFHPEQIHPVAKSQGYASLSYGDPQSFVCSKAIPAIGKLSDRPNLQLMWENYIHDRPQGVWQEIGGLVEYNGEMAEDVGGWRNACAVRMSYMLNKAGIKIPYIESATVSGGKGEYHFYRLDDLQNFLIRRFGSPEYEYHHGPSSWEDLPSKPGLLIQRFPGSNFTGHASIWNGAGLVDNSVIGGFHILFWELPCSLPQDRKDLD